MKKILLLLFVFLSFTKANANPIMVYFTEVRINEFSVSQSNEWYLELSIDVPNQLSLDSTLIDSLVLFSNTGHSVIKTFLIDSRNLLIVITKDSLLNNFEINLDQDNIAVYFYGLGITENGSIQDILGYPDEISYGFRIPLKRGQSICLNSQGYGDYIDDSPTMGLPNDTIDAVGILHGKLFDKNNNLIKSGSFQIEIDLPILNFDSEGNFNLPLLSNFYFCKWLNNKDSAIIYDHSCYYLTDTFSIIIEPHSNVTHDIHLTDYELTTNIENLTVNQFIDIIIAPNPIHENALFYINISDNLNFSLGKLSFYDINGRLIKQIDLPNSHKIIQEISFTNWPIGSYIYKLSIDNKYYKSDQIIKTN
jgi:hypothetical protein